MDTFYSSYEQIDTSNVQNSNALPIPADVAASYRLLGEGMQALMADNPNRDFVENILDEIRHFVDTPPTKPKGVPDEFIAELERVPKKFLKKDDECPICGTAFLDGKSRPLLEGVNVYAVYGI
jgi:hypothetical protein